MMIRDDYSAALGKRTVQSKDFVLSKKNKALVLKSQHRKVFSKEKIVH